MHGSKGVFLDSASLGDDIDFNGLYEMACDWTTFQHTSPEQTFERCQDAEIIITNKVVIDKNLIAQLPKLKLICVAATGVNNIDLDAAKKAGILVTNVKGYAGTSIAQMVFSLLLALTNHVSEYHQAVMRGDWSKSKTFCLFDFPIMELANKTLGLIGYGELGKSVELLAEAFGMKVLVAEHKGKDEIRAGRTAFASVIKDADVLSIHCPLTDETQDLIGAKELSTMKSSAILINTARGGIVNEEALINALRQKHIAAAATDVLSQEPPKAEHLMLAAKLDNLIITPHVAWASKEARNRLFQQLLDNIKHYLNGELDYSPI